MAFNSIVKRYRTAMADAHEPQKPTSLIQNERNPYSTGNSTGERLHNTPKVGSHQSDTSLEASDEAQLSTQISHTTDPAGLLNILSSYASSSIRKLEGRSKSHVGEAKGEFSNVLPHAEDGEDYSVKNKVQPSSPAALQVGRKGRSSSSPGFMRDQKIKSLAMENRLKHLVDSRRRHKEEKKELERKYDKLKRSHDSCQKSIQNWQGKYGKLKKEYDKAQETVDGQNLHITKLTETISLSGNRNITTTRDDDYFEAEFSRLEGAIHQWVFRNFRGKSDLKLKDFRLEVQESFGTVILRDEALAEPEIKLKEIEAVVVHQLVTYIFWGFPFGMPREKRLIRHLGTVYSSLGGTDLEKRKWHAQTLDMIINDSRYEEHLRNGIEVMTRYLKDCLDIRVTGGSPKLRDQGLIAIIGEAVKLSEEINRQISCFELYYMIPASRYDPTYMRDVSGILDDDEKEKPNEGENIFVQKVLFPAVARYGFDETGKLMKDPVIVRKATVTVLRSELKE